MKQITPKQAAPQTALTPADSQTALVVPVLDPILAKYITPEPEQENKFLPFLQIINPKTEGNEPGPGDPEWFLVISFGGEKIPLSKGWSLGVWSMKRYSRLYLPAVKKYEKTPLEADQTPPPGAKAGYSALVVVLQKDPLKCQFCSFDLFGWADGFFKKPIAGGLLSQGKVAEFVISDLDFALVTGKDGWPYPAPYRLRENVHWKTRSWTPEEKDAVLAEAKADETAIRGWLESD